MPAVPSRYKLLIVLAVAITACVLLQLHVDGVNGPWYWRWKWRRLDGWRVYPLMALAVMPFFGGQYLANTRQWIAVPLMLFMASSLGMSVAAIGSQIGAFSLEPIYRTVNDVDANGYFYDAGTYLSARNKGHLTFRSFVGNFPRFMPAMHVHGKTRPPTITLCYAMFRDLFPSERLAAIAASFVIGLLASLSIPATFQWVRLLMNDNGAALAGAGYLAISPGFVLLFPDINTVYPAVACLMLVTWLLAITRRQFRYAAACGIVASVMCLFSYNLLVLGFILVGLSAVFFRPICSRGSARWFAMCAATAIGCFCGIQILIWVTTGFNPIATFIEALHQQAIFNKEFARPFPGSIPWDLYDFILASGWMSFVLIAMGISQWQRDRRTAVILLCIAQPLLVAGLGLLQAETARVWLFMQPLLMVPVGMELSTWRPALRNTVFASLAMVTAVMARNMWFLIWAPFH